MIIVIRIIIRIRIRIGIPTLTWRIKQGVGKEWENGKKKHTRTESRLLVGPSRILLLISLERPPRVREDQGGARGSLKYL